MIKAIPINKQGEQIGESKNFSDAHWNKMISHFGKNIAWKIVENKISITKPIHKEIELIAKDNKENNIVSTKNAKKKFYEK